VTQPDLLALALAAGGMVSAASAAYLSQRRKLVAATAAAELAESRAETLRVIANATRDITSLDPRAVSSAVCKATVRVGFDMAEIDVADGALTTLTPLYSTGMPDDHVPHPQAITECVAGLAYQTGKTVVIPDYSQWPGALPHLRALGILGTCGATPVTITDGVVVILSVAMHAVEEVTDFQRECLELLARQAGVALDNARQYDERQELQGDLAHQAFHDALTGLGNRAQFLTALRSRATDGIPRGLTAVLFIDLDGFKGVNDAMGHAAGDQLLEVVAQRLMASIRPHDSLARFGGDEFTLLLEQISAPAEAEAVARRVTARVQEPIVIDGVTVSVSASIGVAFGDAGTDGEAMLREADAAMYRGKAIGRGAIVVSTRLARQLDAAL
jgi:diguanylate cyclase (GGDEF)-like protein